MLAHVLVLFLIFKGDPHCVPQWLHQLALPPPVHEDSIILAMVSLRPRQSSLFSGLGVVDFVTAILTDGRGWRTVVVMCISLRTGDVARAFTHLLAIRTLSLQKCLSKSSA